MKNSNYIPVDREKIKDDIKKIQEKNDKIKARMKEQEREIKELEENPLPTPNRRLSDIEAPKNPLTEEKQKFRDVMARHKAKFIKENTLKSMVYENGAAMSFVFKELGKLNNQVKYIIDILNENFNFPGRPSNEEELSF